jgi:predicted component of type VI protein secretion system
MPRLKVTTGKQAGKTVDLTKSTIIGRGETAQVQITDNHASREHCKVFDQGGTWMVADLNSRNGIKVNDVQTTRKNLSNGDRIIIGETVIVFETAGGAAPAAVSTAKSDKEAAFAAARAGAPAGSRTGRPAAAAESGLKVSDRVLQFHKVDAKNATVMDIDLAQSAGMSRLMVTVACLAFLGGVIWLIVKLMG